MREELKKIIQKANPEIMESKFGCWIEGKRKSDGKGIMGQILQHYTADTLEVMTGFSGRLVDIDAITKILGRPITLADVLIALEKKKYKRFKKVMEETNEIIWDFWNLKENLDGQSEETIEFLYNLLNPKT